MPNHVHMILCVTHMENTVINKNIRKHNKNEQIYCENGRICCENGRQIAAPTKIQTVIGNMKRYVSMQIGYSVWQKSFHDHIIRDKNEYNFISKYINENPINWKDDCYFIKSK